MKGKVVWFKNQYGFIKADATDDEYFIHHTQIEMEGYRTLKAEAAVTFDVELGPRGKPQATNVKVVK